MFRTLPKDPPLVHNIAVIFFMASHQTSEHSRQHCIQKSPLAVLTPSWSACCMYDNSKPLVRCCFERLPSHPARHSVLPVVPMLQLTSTGFAAFWWSLPPFAKIALLSTQQAAVHSSGTVECSTECTMYRLYSHCTVQSTVQYNTALLGCHLQAFLLQTVKCMPV